MFKKMSERLKPLASSAFALGLCVASAAAWAVKVGV